MYLTQGLHRAVLLAVPWADAVFTPVNTRWSAAEIAYCLADSDTRVLLVDDAFAPMLDDLRQRCGVLQTVIHCGESTTPSGTLSYERLIAEHEPVPDAGRGGEALAGIYYTGGTTGTPKGVMLSHANLTISALGTASTGAFMVPGGRLLHAAPMFHLADGAAWVARNALGGSHVIVPGFTAGGVAEAIATHEVTDVLLVPTMIQLLVDSPDAATADLSSLRHLIYGASPISEAVLERAAKVLPSVQFLQLYGMTELSPTTTALTPGDHDDPRCAARPGGRRRTPRSESSTTRIGRCAVAPWARSPRAAGT